MNRKLFFLTFAFVTLIAVIAVTVTAAPVKPGKKEKCPVCGMFIYKYPDWVGQISFGDGSVFFFDGGKDLFKYYFNLDKYNPGKNIRDISDMRVTDYYKVSSIDARKAFFVVGSDVFGPMGNELVAFDSKDAALEFKADHKGSDMLTFEQVTPAVIDGLD